MYGFLASIWLQKKLWSLYVKVGKVCQRALRLHIPILVFIFWNVRTILQDCEEFCHLSSRAWGGTWRSMDACKPVLNWVCVSSNSQVSLPDCSEKLCWNLIFGQLRICRAVFYYLDGLHLNRGEEDLWGCTPQIAAAAATGQCIFPLPITRPQLRVCQAGFWPGFSWQFVGFIFFTEQQCHG